MSCFFFSSSVTYVEHDKKNPSYGDLSIEFVDGTLYKCETGIKRNLPTCLATAEVLLDSITRCPHFQDCKVNQTTNSKGEGLPVNMMFTRFF